MNTLKLNKLEKNILLEKEFTALRGGNWICSCSCYYRDSEGGSSIDDNRDANAAISGGGHSVNGDNKNTVTVCAPK